MDSYTISILVMLVILVGITIVFVIKTPKKQLFPKNDKSGLLQKELESYSDEYQAIIVKGDKKKTFIATIPIIILLIPSALLNIYVDYFLDTPIEESKILGYDISWIFIFNGLVYLPIIFLVFAIPFAFEGYKVYKNNYSPPLDATRWSDFISKKSKYHKISGILMMLMPIFILPIILYSYSTFERLQVKMHKSSQTTNIFNKK